jgi:hypothetical protein
MYTLAGRGWMPPAVTVCNPARFRRGRKRRRQGLLEVMMAISTVLLRSANALALAATLIVNGLASGLPLNGQTTGEISDRFQVYFVPAGYVFSIWGLIYLALLGFVIYQWLPAQRHNPLIQRIGWLFVLSCAGNVAWVFAWHWEFFGLSLLMMLVMLATLAGIYLRLDIGREAVGPGDRLGVHLPFSLYLGWITVATIANTTTVLDYIQWGRWGLTAEAWMLVMLTVTVALTGLIAWLRRDRVYLLVIVWALAGIAVKHGEVSIVANAAWLATAAVGTLVLLLTLGWRRSSSPEQPS